MRQDLGLRLWLDLGLWLRLRLYRLLLWLGSWTGLGSKGSVLTAQRQRLDLR